MVRIYHSKHEKSEDVGNGWTYWGIFKNQEEEKHVWFKDVTKEDAERYELENELLD